LASVIWLPEDYLRFYLQYSHAKVTGGPSASTVEPTTSSSDPIDERSYGVDVVAARAQIDF
jgi:phosphate-selective porin OprO/OprP